MAVEIHSVLSKYMPQCYAWKKARQKNTDKPWVSDGVRKMVKKKKAVFREGGRSETWKRLDKCIKNTLNIRKSAYNRKQKEKLESLGRNGQWFNVSKYLLSDEMVKKWDITDLKPGQDPKELANELADTFI